MKHSPAPKINPGKRCLAAGRTGSGKSTWGSWMLERSPGRWVIMNPKHTAAYQDLPDSVVIPGLDFKAMDLELEKGNNRFMIVNPGSHEASPEEMDAFVMRLHQEWTHVGLCCDELYAMHQGNARAGQGLLGWLTRGRELKQSFLGLTQRPAWLSQFLYSESDYICTMSLALPDDRKRLVSMTGESIFNEELPPHYWLWYDMVQRDYRYFEPVPI